MLDTIENHVRLSNRQIGVIRAIIKDTFGADAKVWLFGSRTDLTKRGGDIDLLVESQDHDPKRLVAAKTKAAARLYLMLDEQDVDIVCKQFAATDFSESVFSNGVRLL